MSNVQVVPKENSPAANAVIERGHMLVRAENDTLSSVAIARPRSVTDVRTRLIAELQALPTMAAGAWYSIPYKTREGGVEKTVNVEGPSVRTARRIAQLWGNCSVESRIIDSGDDFCDVAGVAIDFETNYRYSIPLRVSRYEVQKKTGQVYKLSDDRWATKIAAARSKAIRNAIFGVIPEALVEEYVAIAKEIASKPKQGRPPKEPLADRIRAKFKSWNIPDAVLAKSVGKAMLEDLTEREDAQKLADLNGLLNALNDGSITVDQLIEQFGDYPDSETPFAETAVASLTEQEAGRP